MKDEQDFLRDFERQHKEVFDFLEQEIVKVMEVEISNQFIDSFTNQGFEDGGFKPWEPRKTTDARGRDITRYRTNRVGKAGELNKYGRQSQGRGILIGHQGGKIDKNKKVPLRESLHIVRGKGYVEAHFNNAYAEVHNEGSSTMPKRQFTGDTPELEKSILDKVDNEFRTIFDRK